MFCLTISEYLFEINGISYVPKGRQMYHIQHNKTDIPVRNMTIFYRYL